MFGLRTALAAPDRWNSPVKSLYAAAAWPSSCGATRLVRLELPDQDGKARAVSLHRRYPRPMIDLGTLGGLHEHQHELAAYCPCCDRWSVLPLADIVAQGKGSLRLPVRVRCRDCGEPGRLQVRPPVPARSSTVGWSGFLGRLTTGLLRKNLLLLLFILVLRNCACIK